MDKHISAERLKEAFITSGMFDIGELGVIIPIIDEQPAISDKAQGGAA
ncbi:MAG: hypothetical protein IJH40_07200 [Ruminococcus sp.]|nr:hypothetical protein [Ruminococcus sp.]MBQ3285412.1 hypothetical protein [Ruminococcus sp.]